MGGVENTNKKNSPGMCKEKRDVPKKKNGKERGRLDAEDSR